jgi:dCMP deaminase
MNATDRIDWYLKIARTIAEASSDRSTKVGCIVVGPDKEIRAQGYNGFPRGVDDENDEWHERPAKYDFVVHAEANAVANAARTGTSLKGCTAYVTAPPCCDCAGLLINAGISKVVWPSIVDDGITSTTLNDRWQEKFQRALQLFRAAGMITLTHPEETRVWCS